MIYVSCQHILCLFTKLHKGGGKMYGNKLKQIRKHLSVTQDNMAKLMNISPRTYVSYERDENNPPYSMLVLLCNKYNVNLNWFIADNGSPFNAPKYEDVKDDVLKEVNEILAKYGFKPQ